VSLNELARGYAGQQADGQAPLDADAGRAALRAVALRLAREGRLSATPGGDDRLVERATGQAQGVDPGSGWRVRLPAVSRPSPENKSWGEATRPPSPVRGVAGVAEGEGPWGRRGAATVRTISPAYSW